MFAYNRGFIETPRMIAMNDGLIAAGQSVTALLTNPANMAAAPAYHIEGLVNIWPQGNRQTYGGGVTDSVSSRTGLALGFAGAYTRIDSKNYGGVENLEGFGLSDTDFRLAMAYPFSDSFRLGISGHYLSLAQNGPGPLKPSPVSGGLYEQDIVVDVSVGAGLAIQPHDNFVIGAMADNLTNPGNGFMPLLVGGGAAFVSQAFVIEADLLADLTTYADTTYAVTGGVELLLGDNYPVRASYGWDSGDEAQALGFGLGYADRGFAADVAARQTIGGVASSTTVGVSLTLRLEGSALLSN